MIILYAITLSIMLFKSILLRKVINSLRYVKINMPYVILYKTLNLIYPSSHKQKNPTSVGYDVEPFCNSNFGEFRLITLYSISVFISTFFRNIFIFLNYLIVNLLKLTIYNVYPNLYPNCIRLR